MNRHACALAFFVLPIIFACGNDSNTTTNSPGSTNSGSKTENSTPSTTKDAATTSCTAPAGSACFDITFTGLWTVDSHPVNFPPNPHFSPLIGTTHNDQLTLWAPGQLATPGIQSMAETGNTSQLKTEINDHISKGVAQTLVEGKRIDATQSTTVSIVASESFSLLTVTSMIAPSPDWFVGVYSLPLRENNEWIDEKTISFNTIYDAGTDDGPNFTSANAPANPHKPIQQLLDQHFTKSSPPIARLVIKRVK